MFSMNVLLLGMLAFLIIVIIRIYNKLVELRQSQTASFAQIDVQLTRRYELIPNLVEAAKAFMKHEQETLEKVIQARNMAFQAKNAATASPGNADAMAKLVVAEGAVKSSLGNFMALSESYPELRSNENMNLLMEELASTENRVAFSRQSYNDATREYNVAREVFPANLVAGIFGFHQATLFVVQDETVRKPIKVQF